MLTIKLNLYGEFKFTKPDAILNLSKQVCVVQKVLRKASLAQIFSH